MTDELKDQRVVTMMSSSELERIDDWMFSHRLRSRGEAIRWLCQFAIQATEGLSALSGMSTEFAHSLIDFNVEIMSRLPDVKDRSDDPINVLGDTLTEDALNIFREIKSLQESTQYIPGAPKLDDAISALIENDRKRRELREAVGWSREDAAPGFGENVGDDREQFKRSLREKRPTKRQDK